MDKKPKVNKMAEKESKYAAMADEIWDFLKSGAYIVFFGAGSAVVYKALGWVFSLID